MGRASLHLARTPSLTMGRSGPLKRLSGMPTLAHVQRERVEAVAHHCAETQSSPTNEFVVDIESEREDRNGHDDVGCASTPGHWGTTPRRSAWIGGLRRFTFNANAARRPPIIDGERPSVLTSEVVVDIESERADRSGHDDVGRRSTPGRWGTTPRRSSWIAGLR